MERMEGNLMNRLSERSKQPEPVVGMGCTLSHYSDREPATVIRVVSATTIDVQADTAIRTDKNGMSESQSYDYEPNPTGAIYRARLTRRGWRTTSCAVVLGYRSMYYDYSF